MTPRVDKRTVVCVKWGTKFSPDYVNVLYRSVSENLTRPFRFLCMTDDPMGLDKRIEVVAFPQLNFPRSAWGTNRLPKVGVLAPGVLADDEIVLQLDLDILVLGDLTAFFDLYQQTPAFYSLREWNTAACRLLVPPALRPDRGTQGSVYLYRAGEQRHIFHHFQQYTAQALRYRRSDARYFPAIAANPDYLPQDWVLSFKKHCVKYWPFNLTTRAPGVRKDTKILAFHGEPLPTDLIYLKHQSRSTSSKPLYGPVPWVRAHWRHYGGELPQD